MFPDVVSADRFSEPEIVLRAPTNGFRERRPSNVGHKTAPGLFGGRQLASEELEDLIFVNGRLGASGVIINDPQYK